MVIAIALPAALLGIALVYQAYRNEREALARHMLTTARAISALVDQELAESASLLQVLSTSSRLVQNDLIGFDARARFLMKDSDRWLILLRPDGQQLINTRLPIGTALPRVELEPEFATAMREGKPYISNLVYGPVAGTKVVDVALPVVRDGELLYSLHLVMLPSALARTLKVERFAPHGVVSIVDRTGTIAARSRSAERFVGLKATPDIVQAIANKAEDVKESVTLEGIPVHAAFSRSPVCGWSVVIGIPNAELYASGRRLLWIGFSITAVLILIAVLMASWIGHTLAQEIETLAADADLIGRGVLPIPSAAGLEETDAVALAMRTMSDRLELALSAAKLGLWSWDAATERISLSERAAEILGMARVVSWAKLEATIHPDDAPRCRAGIERTVAEQSRYEVEYRVTPAPGVVRWVAANGKPVFDKKGQVWGLIGILKDITERRLTELQQEALYHLASRVNRAEALPEVYEATLDAISRSQTARHVGLLIRRGEDGRMVFRVSRGLSETFRGAIERRSPWAETEIAPKPLRIEDIAGSFLDAEAKQALVKENVHSLVFIPISSENQLFGAVVLYHDQPHVLTTEELRALEAIATQVAFAIERQNKANVLEALVDQRTTSLRQTVEQMHEFSYSVSHDLRAPVRAMRGYAEAVLEDFGHVLQEEGRQLLLRIQHNGARMDRLIQDLLTYSRLTQSVALEPVALQKLFDEVIQQYPATQPKNADIEIKGPLPSVIAHEPSLTQVVSNLLSNAVKFVAPGVRPRVVITAAVSEGKVKVFFQDNGIGINPRSQARLFGMFERIHPEKTYEGTGIGLAIVRKAMERMNGAVGVESDGVAGSTFWIELPAV